MSFVIAIGFLFVSLVAYALLGGADFGVGLLELFAPKAQRPRLRAIGTHAIAPVWEANHIWIIIALVVLFVGFPGMHVTIMTALHIPMVIMLVGIVLRGTAFAFRYYQLGPEAEAALPVWNALFRAGSLMVPMAFGMICAALSQGDISLKPTGGYSAWIAPWLGAFPIATGVFVTCLFAWIAAVLLSGELSGAERDQMVRLARRWTVATLVTGAIASGLAWLDGNPWLTGPGAGRRIALVGLGTLGMIATWVLLARQQVWLLRGVVGLTVAAVVGGYWLAGYPVGIVLQDGGSLTWPATAAPDATLQALAIALIVGSLLILPGLAWLYRVFKRPAPVDD